MKSSFKLCYSTGCSNKFRIRSEGFASRASYLCLQKFHFYDKKIPWKNPLKKNMKKSLLFRKFGFQFSFGIVCTYNDFLRYNEKRFFNRTSCKTILTFTQCIISPYFFGYFCNLFWLNFHGQNVGVPKSC